MPRVGLHWKLTPDEQNAIDKAQEVLDQGKKLVSGLRALGDLLSGLSGPPAKRSGKCLACRGSGFVVNEAGRWVRCRCWR